jgi:hypothetical protein
MMPTRRPPSPNQVTTVPDSPVAIRNTGKNNGIDTVLNTGCIPCTPAMNVINSFPHLTISMQNCNSLNISTECDKQLAKIVAITSVRSSIILLSDLCLCANQTQIEKIQKIFLTNSNKSYQFFYNSDKNSRGVGILIELIVLLDNR